MRNLNIEANTAELGFNRPRGLSSARGIFRLLGDVYHRWTTALQRDWENRAALASLDMLETRLLDDMGLTRDDLFEARKHSDPAGAICLLKQRRRNRISRGSW